MPSGIIPHHRPSAASELGISQSADAPPELRHTPPARPPPAPPHLHRTSLLPGSIPRLRVVTWNARALLHNDLELARGKERRLNYCAGLADAIVVQETHGGRDDLEACGRRYSATHVAFVSPGPHRGTAALLTLVSHALFDAHVATEVSEVVPGRVLRVKIMYHGGTLLSLYNIHNYGINAHQLRHVRELRRLNSHVEAWPCFWGTRARRS